MLIPRKFYSSHNWLGAITHLPHILNNHLEVMRFLLTERDKMSKELDDVKAGVAAVVAAVADAVKAIKDLAAQVGANVPPHPLDDPADLEAVAMQLTSIASGLEAAIPVPVGP